MLQRIFNPRVRVALYAVIIAAAGAAVVWGLATREQLEVVAPLVMAVFGLGMALANVPTEDTSARGRRYRDDDGDGEPDEFTAEGPPPF